MLLSLKEELTALKIKEQEIREKIEEEEKKVGASEAADEEVEEQGQGCENENGQESENNSVEEPSPDNTAENEDD